MTEYCRLIERGSGRSIVERLEVADDYWSRLCGLQLRPTPPPGFGLLLVPCSSIHTCFMRFPVDILAVDRVGCVIDVRTGVRPWRMVTLGWSTAAVVEVPAGSLAGTVEVGALLSLEVPAERRGRICRRLKAWSESAVEK
jgi:uncharacterized protein